MILQECQRTTRFRPEQFHELSLSTPVDLQGWKQTWIQASRAAEQLLPHLPAEEVGCLYLDAESGNARPASASFLTLADTWAASAVPDL